MSRDSAPEARRRLTSTSYTVLGLLCLQSWSGYELATQMQRGWNDVWPRAVRSIYNEPKKLVRAGYAAAHEEQTGERTRTVYEATAVGHNAFAQWLSEPPAPPELEAEALVKVLLGEHGTKEQLLAAIASLAEFADERSRGLHQMGLDYLSTGGPIPERQHVLHLVGGFLAQYHAAMLRWAAWAHTEVGTWHGVDGPHHVPDLDRLADTVRRTFEDNLALAEECLRRLGEERQDP